jgi:hypothetical protein
MLRCSEEVTAVNRFLAKVKRGENGCLNWTSTLWNGYGNFWYQGANRKAYRVAYEWFFGKIPEGLSIDHLCRNRACVNPEHMEVVTMSVNIARRPIRLTCPRGHKKERVWWKKSPVCRTCHRESAARSKRWRA